MTREEAIKYLKEMKDECDDTIHKVRYVTQEEALDMAIKALEQEPILDKVRAEIEQDAFKDVSGSKFIFVNRVNQIIDKYKVGSEEAHEQTNK